MLTLAHLAGQVDTARDYYNFPAEVFQLAKARSPLVPQIETLNKLWGIISKSE